LSHTLIFLPAYMFANSMSETLEFQTMNHFRSNNNSLKYLRFTPSGCRDIAIVKSESVAKTQFLCKFVWQYLNLILVAFQKCRQYFRLLYSLRKR